MATAVEKYCDPPHPPTVTIALTFYDDHCQEVLPKFLKIRLTFFRASSTNRGNCDLSLSVRSSVFTSEVVVLRDCERAPELKNMRHATTHAKAYDRISYFAQVLLRISSTVYGEFGSGPSQPAYQLIAIVELLASVSLLPPELEEAASPPELSRQPCDKTPSSGLFNNSR